MASLTFRFYKTQFLSGVREAYDAPPGPLVGWGGRYPSPFTTPSMPSASTLSAFGTEKRTLEVALKTQLLSSNV